MKPEPLTFASPRPLMDLSGCKWALDLDEDRVVALIEDGSLAWAFDIRTRDVTRRELRVLAACVAAYRGNPSARLALEGSEVVKLILPGDKPWLAGTELQRSLNCCCTHVMNLIREGSLKLVGRTKWRRGPGGSPRVSRQSATAFLELANRRSI